MNYLQLFMKGSHTDHPHKQTYLVSYNHCFREEYFINKDDHTESQTKKKARKGRKKTA